jgi:hypothetical protein
MEQIGTNWGSSHLTRPLPRSNFVQHFSCNRKIQMAKKKNTSVRLCVHQDSLPYYKMLAASAVKDFSVMFVVNINLFLIKMATNIHEL